jgi:ABC-type phosphate transport system substrate-binding protein
MPTRTEPPLAITRRCLAAVLVAAFAATAMLAPSAAADETQNFRVIVHPKNPLSGASRDFLNDVFLKRTTRWADGEVIKPVDLRPDATVRRHFSEQVLKRSVAAVRSYWQQRIFSGRGVPPPELDTDAAVIQYVANNPQAIGYVSPASALGATKELAVR